VAYNTNVGDRAYDPTPLAPLKWNRPFAGALVAAAATGLAVGVYETCWSLLMHAHHASTLQIRLSWTMFCLPFVLLSRTGGWIADHLNRRKTALFGLLNGAAFLATYPHIHNNVVMLFLGSAESLGAALSSPSIASMLSQGAHARELSRRQGLYATSTTASLALASIASGFLFTVNTALPFTIVAVMSSVLAFSTLYFWRGVNGRIATSAAPDTPPV
jgi:DHA1 family multidrug resistance protein-like MFS transporter